MLTTVHKHTLGIGLVSTVVEQATISCFTSRSSFVTSLIEGGRSGHESSDVQRKSGPLIQLLVTRNDPTESPRDAQSAGFFLLSTYFHCEGDDLFLLSR